MYAIYTYIYKNMHSTHATYVYSVYIKSNYTMFPANSLFFIYVYICFKKDSRLY